MKYFYGLILICFLFCHNQVIGQDAYRLIENISYQELDPQLMTDYMNERCKLDLYLPSNINNFPTIIWFHGGGLKAGNKHIPHELKDKGYAVATVNYRLYPKVKVPVYIEDAAASIAWVYKHIEEYGGNKDKIVVTGHSAGGYLASMVALDTTYLTAYDIHPNQIAGYVPFSGHTLTHFTVRDEQGIDGNTPTIDKYAPIAHMRKDTPPILFITGDRDLELLGRYEETAYMWRMMKIVGNENVYLKELDGFNHGNMYLPAIYLLLDFVRKYAKS